MSIEDSLNRIASALEKLAAGREPAGTVTVTPPEAPSNPQPQPAAPAAAAQSAPAPATPAPAAPATAPTPTATADAPFTDGAGLTQYVMTAYKELGPEKGAQIQTVLNNLGYQNINDVKPEHYGQLHQGIEALKA